MRPYNLPRFNRSFGSNNCLIFCMTGKSLPGCGHKRKRRFAASGANSIAPLWPFRPGVRSVGMIDVDDAVSGAGNRRPWRPRDRV